MSLIPREALYRTAIGTVLKSVGIIARIFDIPLTQGELRQKVAQRELLDLAVIVGASLTIEAVSHALGPKRKLTGFLQFLPQLTAYIFAEWFSRKATNYNQYFNSHLKQARNSGPSTLPAQSSTHPPRTATLSPPKQNVAAAFSSPLLRFPPMSPPAYPFPMAYGSYQAYLPTSPAFTRSSPYHR